MSWQPIASAPQDGTTVHLWNPEDGYLDACGYCDMTGRWVLTSCGEFVFERNDDTPRCYENPTHWQPLPAPPEAP